MYSEHKAGVGRVQSDFSEVGSGSSARSLSLTIIINNNIITIIYTERKHGNKRLENSGGGAPKNNHVYFCYTFRDPKESSGKEWDHQGTFLLIHTALCHGASPNYLSGLFLTPRHPVATERNPLFLGLAFFPRSQPPAGRGCAVSLWVPR